MAGFFEDFEALNNGNINGQNGWVVASGTVEVQTTIVKNGNKAVKLSTGSSLRRTMTGDEISSADGDILSFYARKETTDDYFQINLKDTDEAGHFIGYVRFFDGDIQIASDEEGPITVKSTYAADTWYFIEIELNYTNEEFRARVDGGSWTVWCDFGAIGTQDEVNFFEIDGNKDSYLDDFSLAFSAPSDAFTPRVIFIT